MLLDEKRFSLSSEKIWHLLKNPQKCTTRPKERPLKNFFFEWCKTKKKNRSGMQEAKNIQIRITWPERKKSFSFFQCSRVMVACIALDVVGWLGGRAQVLVRPLVVLQGALGQQVSRQVGLTAQQRLLQVLLRLHGVHVWYKKTKKKRYEICSVWVRIRITFRAYQIRIPDRVM